MRNADSNDDEREVEEEEGKKCEMKITESVVFERWTGSFGDKEIFVGRLCGGVVIFARDKSLKF